MAIVDRRSVVPLELRFDHTKNSNQRTVNVLLLSAAVRKRIWWHTKSYSSIAGILLLSAGSLIILQLHWLYRRLTHMSAFSKEKEVLKDVS